MHTAEHQRRRAPTSPNANVAGALAGGERQPAGTNIVSLVAVVNAAALVAV